MKYDDYAKWVKTQPNHEWNVWKAWPGTLVPSDPELGNKPSTQDELLVLHYKRWKDDPDNDKTGASIIAFFESLESEYEQAIKVLGEDYFA